MYSVQQKVGLETRLDNYHTPALNVTSFPAPCTRDWERGYCKAYSHIALSPGPSPQGKGPGDEANSHNVLSMFLSNDIIMMSLHTESTPWAWIDVFHELAFKTDRSFYIKARLID